MAYKVIDGKVVRTGKPLRHTNAEQLRRLQRDKEIAQEWARRQRLVRTSTGRPEPQPAITAGGHSALAKSLATAVATDFLALEAAVGRRLSEPPQLDHTNLEALCIAHESDDPTAAEQALFKQIRKGEYRGACNRSACLAPGATWYNRGSMRFYCAECAAMLNHANRNDPFCQDEPLCHEVPTAE